LSELAQADVTASVEIIGTLQRIGPVTPEIIPSLIRKLRREPPSPAPADARPIDFPEGFRRDEVVVAALRALQELARTDNDAVPLLIATLGEADPATEARVLQTLGRIGPLTPAVVPTVTRFLHAANRTVQLSAIRACGTLGAAAAPAVPGLIRLLEAQWAGLTAENSAPASQNGTSRPAVLAETEDAPPAGMRWRSFRPLRESEMLALELVRALARIGPPAREAIPTLARLMLQIKTELRYETALATWRIERSNATAQTVLIEALNVPAPEVPRQLVRHFTTMGVEELPILNTALDHIDEEIRTAAFHVMSALALESEPALLALERVADDPTNPLRERAARTLRSIQLKGASPPGASNRLEEELRLVEPR
jgi:HEAT repeat protein